MATFTQSDDLQGAEFVDADLRRARFVGADLSGVVMRGVQVDGADIDAPWLLSDGELACWSTASTWPPSSRPSSTAASPAAPSSGPRTRTVCARPGPRSSARGRPRSNASRRCRTARSTSRSTGSGRSRRRCGTWCWPRTRGWARRSWRSSSRSIRSGCSMRPRRPTARMLPMSAAAAPSYDEVLRGPGRPGRDGARLPRHRHAGQLAEERRNPHDPAYPETVLSCLHTILEEEWEHHRYAVRDLDGDRGERLATAGVTGHVRMIPRLRLRACRHCVGRKVRASGCLAHPGN